MKTEQVIDKIKEVCRRQHLAYSTEKTYCHWVSVYCYWLAKNKPDCDSTKKVEMFLSSEARRGVSASTQNQAFAAILFLRAGITGIVTPHHLRHAYATHAVNQGAFVRDVQVVMGHRSLETTMGYLHAESDRVTSPFAMLGIKQ